MKGVYAVVLFLLQLGSVWPRLDKMQTVDDYMNICLDGRNHKRRPGPERGLIKQFCSPWASRSCCTSSTAEALHIDKTWLNFDWDHCKTLSPRCREHFLMDLCFYECSPNVGPWLVEDVRKIRNERFMHVPLCQTVCDNWWDACKDDFTCLDNWAEGFDWSKGINTCPQNTTCRPFHEIYTGANNFCETLMGHSFKVVNNTEDCFFLWFDPKYPNPNEPLARKKASSLLGVPYQVATPSSKNKGNGLSDPTIFIIRMSILFSIFAFSTNFDVLV